MRTAILCAFVFFAATTVLAAEHRLEREERQRRILVRQLLQGPAENGPAIRNGHAQTVLVDALSRVPLSNEQAYMWPLSDSQLAHLRFQAAGPNSLVQRGGQAGGVMDVRWPVRLRAPEFEVFRQAFEQARATAASAARQERLDWDHEQRLTDSVQTLREVYLEQNPHHVRCASPAVWLQYHEGKKFLDSLHQQATEFVRVGGVSDEPVLAECNTVVALVQECIRRGLVFAPAMPQDETTYHYVYRALLDLCRQVQGELDLDDIERPADEQPEAVAERRMQVRQYRDSVQAQKAATQQLYRYWIYQNLIQTYRTRSYSVPSYRTYTYTISR